MFSMCYDCAYSDWFCDVPMCRCFNYFFLKLFVGHFVYKLRIFLIFFNEVNSVYLLWRMVSKGVILWVYCWNYVWWHLKLFSWNTEDIRSEIDTRWWWLTLIFGWGQVEAFLFVKEKYSSCYRLNLILFNIFYN